MKKRLSFLMFGLGVIFLYMPDASAQTVRQAEILRSFEEGRISAETAVLEQFRLAYNYKPVEGETSTPPIKCMTPALMILEQHRYEISAEAMREINTYIAPAPQVMEEVYYSESGRFEIHFDRTGTHAVPSEDANRNGIPDYVEWTAEAADSSYRHEVLRLGFINPIPEGLTYEIQLRNLAGGYYGLTYPLTGSLKSYIVIENDFASGYPPNSDPEGDVKGALKVTVAHEFKHAIQYENEWEGPNNRTWTEMDATLMEEVVYDNVNDYYNYIKQSFESDEPTFSSVFGNPQTGVPNSSGQYSNMSWLLYYAEALGMNVLRDTWLQLGNDHNMYFEDALTNSISDHGYSFKEEFVRNHLWHYSSRDRSESTGYGFEEKAFYPNSSLEEQFISVPSDSTTIVDIPTLAARYYEVYPDPGDAGIIDLAVNFDSTQVGIGVLIFTKGGEVEESVTTGTGKPQVYIPFEEYEWQDVEKLGIVVANYSTEQSTGAMHLFIGKNDGRFKVIDPIYNRPEEFVLYPNYPNPFNPETTIEFDLENSANVLLEVYDVTGRKVRTLVNENRRFGKYTERFVANDLASGVYIYRLKVGDEVRVRKMTLIK